MVSLQFLCESRAHVSGPRPETARCRTPPRLKTSWVKVHHSRCSAGRAAERPGLQTVTAAGSGGAPDTEASPGPKQLREPTPRATSRPPGESPNSSMAHLSRLVAEALLCCTPACSLAGHLPGSTAQSARTSSDYETAEKRPLSRVPEGQSLPQSSLGKPGYHPNPEDTERLFPAPMLPQIFSLFRTDHGRAAWSQVALHRLLCLGRREPGEEDNPACLWGWWSGRISKASISV